MDQLNKRDFLKSATLLGTAAATVESATAENLSRTTSASKSQTADLVDEHFKSETKRRFGSQVIHHGEQAGFQVTPISQDKAAPGYQRPGNFQNPTVAALLRKILEMEGTEDAIGGPCGMSIISQTYLALMKPGDRLVRPASFTSNRTLIQRWKF